MRTELPGRNRLYRFIAPILLSLAMLSMALLSPALASPAVGDTAAPHFMSGASPMTGTPMAQTEGARNYAAMMTQFTDELGLTSQQQTDIQIIMTDYATRLGDIAKLGRTAANALLSMEPTAPEYRKLTDESAAMAATSAAETVVLLAEMRGKLYMVLTATQRATLKQKLEDAKARHAEKHAPEAPSSEVTE